MPTTIAVISDLHCHHSSTGPAESMLITDANRYPILQHPVQSLLSLIDLHKLEADVLLMPGDITNKIDPQGMISGWSFVNEIAKKLGAVVMPTLGNHDVNSRNPGEDAFKTAKCLSPRFPVETEDAFNQYWSRGFCILRHNELLVAIVNTVASHSNESEAKRGLITEVQLEQLKTSLDEDRGAVVKLALCHHHPLLHEDIGLGTDDVMTNGSLLIQALAERGFNLLVHGHKHHPKLTCISAASFLPILAAGSFSAGMKNGLASRTRNLFHLITLEDNSSNGTIVTWQFKQAIGWRPSTWEAADFPHKTGFGCTVDPKTIANRIRDCFDGLGQKFSQWSEIVSKVPEAPFMPPSAFQSVGKHLMELGIEVVPAAPEEPRVIGRNA